MPTNKSPKSRTGEGLCIVLASIIHKAQHRCGLAQKELALLVSKNADSAISQALNYKTSLSAITLNKICANWPKDFVPLAKGTKEERPLQDELDIDCLIQWALHRCDSTGPVLSEVKILLRDIEEVLSPYVGTALELQPPEPSFTALPLGDSWFLVAKRYFEDDKVQTMLGALRDRCSNELKGYKHGERPAAHRDFLAIPISHDKLATKRLSVSIGLEDPMWTGHWARADHAGPAGYIINTADIAHRVLESVRSHIRSLQPKCPGHIDHAKELISDEVKDKIRLVATDLLGHRLTAYKFDASAVANLTAAQLTTCIESLKKLILTAELAKEPDPAGIELSAAIYEIARINSPVEELRRRVEATCVFLSDLTEIDIRELSVQMWSLGKAIIEILPLAPESAPEANATQRAGLVRSLAIKALLRAKTPLKSSTARVTTGQLYEDCVLRALMTAPEARELYQRGREAFGHEMEAPDEAQIERLLPSPEMPLLWSMLGWRDGAGGRGIAAPLVARAEQAAARIRALYRLLADELGGYLPPETAPAHRSLRIAWPAPGRVRLSASLEDVLRFDPQGSPRYFVVASTTADSMPLPIFRAELGQAIGRVLLRHLEGLSSLLRVEH